MKVVSSEPGHHKIPYFSPLTIDDLGQIYIFSFFPGQSAPSPVYSECVPETFQPFDHLTSVHRSLVRSVEFPTQPGDNENNQRVRNQTGQDARTVVRGVLCAKDSRTNDTTDATTSHESCRCECSLPLSADVVTERSRQHAELLPNEEERIDLPLISDQSRTVRVT